MLLLLFTADFDIVEVLEVSVVHIAESAIGRLEHLIDGFGQFVPFDNYGLGRTAAHTELDFVQGLEVGGIRDADEYPVTAFEQRQRTVFLDQILADDLGYVRIDLQHIDIDDGYAKFVRSRMGDDFTFPKAIFDQEFYEGNFVAECVLKRLACRFFFEEPVRDELARQAA